MVQQIIVVDIVPNYYCTEQNITDIFSRVSCYVFLKHEEFP
jgi:hypothetical protein